MNKLKNKSLRTKILVYDDNCPLCKAYSAWFIKWGLLSESGRIGYSQINELISSKIDHERYKREIALVDTGSESTLYGIDSLFYIFCNNFPLLKPILHFDPVYQFAQALYPFISYNRKIIAPYKKIGCDRDCTPPFHLQYRLAFITFAVLLSTLLTVLFGLAIHNSLVEMSKNQAMLFALIGTGGGWLVQGLFATTLKPFTRVSYYGHLATLMIIGTLLLLPTILIYLINGYSPTWLTILCVLLSFVIMFKQHYDRISILKLSQGWTLLWMLNLLTSLTLTSYFFGVLQLCLIS